ncbi:2,3-bisphosphoglycerate-independent phosphoglycerate mutase [Agaribacterium sp. ZY112]|uniref:2,3-bisphosphoglycerate-independent phosphoglycerate mutase n=1 Tax=Agaribacterium sp. ZY112 TaxID=3233574 RepID=UPI003525339E
MTEAKKPVALIILDGYGYSDSDEYNAIKNANAPVMKELMAKGPRTLIGTSGLSVGLPDGQMGNSEVGHMTLGAGRVVYQNFTRINKAIEDGDFFTNDAYIKAVDTAVAADKAVHILGCLSSGGVHSHEEHMLAMIELAAKRGAKKIYLHAMLDGRDVPPRSAEGPLKLAADKFAEVGVGRVASIIGRFYALDRDNRWDRVEKSYNLIVDGSGEYTAASGLEGLKAAYERDENDEFVAATAITDAEGNVAKVEDGDSVIFMNFRPDRARQMTRAFVNADFDGFERNRVVKLADFVMTTEYAADIKASCAFPPENLVNTFGEVLAKAGKTQLRIAETEKYAHVTFFFSGGQEDLFEGEERILIPSPNVETYDQQPEMSAPELTEKLVAAIESGKYDAIVCNYANCDQVGHTGIYEAAVKAVEAVDACLVDVFAALEKVGGEALVTADHGNVEEMFDVASGQAHTQHTTLPVPLIYVGQRNVSLKDGGSLADIAPSMLQLLGMQQPSDMNGQSLVEEA